MNGTPIGAGLLGTRALDPFTVAASAGQVAQADRLEAAAEAEREARAREDFAKRLQEALAEAEALAHLPQAGALPWSQFVADLATGQGAVGAEARASAQLGLERSAAARLAQAAEAGFSGLDARLAPPAPAGPEAPEDAAGATEAAALARRAAREADEPQQAFAVLPAGLPVAQPAAEKLPEGPVPLAQVPQLVSGQIATRVEAGQAVTALEFHVNPPSIGPVGLQFKLVDRTLNVQLAASTQEAKAALETHVEHIKALLLGHSFKPESVQVVVAPKAASGQAGGGVGSQETSGMKPGAAATHARRRRAGAEDTLGALPGS